MTSSRVTFTFNFINSSDVCTVAYRPLGQRRSYWVYCDERTSKPAVVVFTVTENDLCCPVDTGIALYSVSPVLKPKPDELVPQNRR